MCGHRSVAAVAPSTGGLTSTGIASGLTARVHLIRATAEVYTIRTEGMGQSGVTITRPVPVKTTDINFY